MAQRPVLLMTRPKNRLRGWEANVVSEKNSHVTDGVFDFVYVYTQGDLSKYYDAIVLDLPEDFDE